MKSKGKKKNLNFFPTNLWANSHKIQVIFCKFVGLYSQKILDFFHFNVQVHKARYSKIHTAIIQVYKFRKSYFSFQICCL